jgi:hypothetical protein
MMSHHLPGRNGEANAGECRDMSPDVALSGGAFRETRRHAGSRCLADVRRISRRLA